ncbi:DEP domain-containing protein 1A isoform X1 [Antechinus flavipes]|uniref:DEP domain-containing protein 1A isoform X1 n=1 Tax=Antechinus flavipes TaxID=38775 RepID=UPI00223618DF|nr:DEP domain-containing protein 1A isoform X1 [Antechinus flavipes]
MKCFRIFLLQWNEVTTCFRAGMPLRKHRQHFKKHGNCFTACEAVDWLYELLRSNSNFGPEVTRQQTVQLLRKFLKNHVIEDIKGRWGSENLDDNNQLFRFPTTSPLKTVPRHHPELRKSNLENISKEKESIFKLRHLSRRTPKKHVFQENTENIRSEIGDENKENPVEEREVSQEDTEEIWRHIILMHLQTILGMPSLEEILDPAQVIPQYIIYNMTNTSKHGVVVLQNKEDDLPHWVLSAMKCLANWPRNNDLSQPAYAGFERDVFRTIADYFLDLPEPLLTFEYYELFVNILVVCGYITVPNRTSGKHKMQDDSQSSKALHVNSMNSFKSTECLLLSLLRKEKRKEEAGTPKTLDTNEQSFKKQCTKKLPLCGPSNRRSRTNLLIGGSCQNLTGLKNNPVLPLSQLRLRCYSMEGIVDTSGFRSTEGSSFNQSDLNVTGQNEEKQFLDSETEENFKMEVCSDGENQKSPCVGFKRMSTVTVQDQEVSCNGKLKSKQLCRSQSLLFNNSKRRSSRINMPVAEITMKPNSVGHLGQSTTDVSVAMESEPWDSRTTVRKRLCQSTLELSERSFPPVSSMLTGTQSLLQPHLERVAIDALQICCLLLPPPNRRKLQLLMRMIARMSQNVDMPKLHDAMGTRSLMIQTFSRCVLCCAEEVDLDELLATRLVSFLMDHHQEILQVPSHLQAAVEKHLDYLRKGHITYPGDELIAALPTYSYCKQISTQEFDEQKVSTSQAAIAELLENIIKDKNLSLKEKKKKLKQFQKEYPAIYQTRFPTTESEAALFGDKPTIKQPMLILRKPKFRSLRY